MGNGLGLWSYLSGLFTSTFSRASSTPSFHSYARNAPQVISFRKRT